MQSLDNSAMGGTTSSESEQPERSELCKHGPGTFLRSMDNPKIDAIAETEHGAGGMTGLCVVMRPTRRSTNHTLIAGVIHKESGGREHVKLVEHSYGLPLHRTRDKPAPHFLSLRPWPTAHVDSCSLVYLLNFTSTEWVSSITRPFDAIATSRGRCGSI